MGKKIYNILYFSVIIFISIGTSAVQHNISIKQQWHDSDVFRTNHLTVCVHCT